MITVTVDAPSVESSLRLGVMECPACPGRLASWGWARVRVVRDGYGGAVSGVRVQPRRARCRECGITQVLLDDRFASRRADAASVIAFAIERNVALGEGVRKIAALVGRPFTTVRGWVRAFAGAAPVIGDRFALLVHTSAGDTAAMWPTPTHTPSGRALSLLEAYAQTVTARLNIVTVAWQKVALVVAHARLFQPTFWGSALQHEPALMSDTGGGES